MEIKSMEAVKTYHASHFDNWLHILYVLDNTLAQARDENAVPLYLTKARIKKPESVYLKLKRKRKNKTDQISDWIGFRVLCLFQQDIEPTFKKLLRIIFELDTLYKNETLSFKLKEINIFNWPHEKANQLSELLLKELEKEKSELRSTVKRKENGFDIAYNKPGKDTIPFSLRFIEKGSGYQSVHFALDITYKNNPAAKCEIQLRTLLQDVWGELEHALSYKKGKIHPHIQDSFKLLSTELAAKDTLVSQLRKIRDEETAFAHYANISAGPMRMFNYPREFISNLFKDDNDFGKWTEYLTKCQNRKNFTCFKSGLSDLRASLDGLKTILANDDNDSEDKYYFIVMENAFLDYCAGNLDKAKSEYESVIARNVKNGRWCPHFRLGEVCLALDKVEEALVAFDKCEELMNDQVENGVELDRYLAKVGLAYSYWSLGREFLPTVIEKMEEAKEALTNHLEQEQLEENEEIVLRLSLSNNLCYYFLEQWIDTPDSSSANDLHSRQQRLEEEFNKLSTLAKSYPSKVSANAFDTLAWYCYQHSQQTKDQAKADALLKEAKEYIVSCEGAFNKSPSRLTSTSIQREHIQTIMSKCV